MQSALLQVASHLTDFSWSPQGMMGIVRQLSATFAEGEQTWWRTGRAVWCLETPTDACQDSVSWGSLWNWREEDHTRWKYFYLPKHIDCEGNTHLSEWKYAAVQNQSKIMKSQRITLLSSHNRFVVRICMSRLQTFDGFIWENVSNWVFTKTECQFPLCVSMLMHCKSITPIKRLVTNLYTINVNLFL